MWHHPGAKGAGSYFPQEQKPRSFDTNIQTGLMLLLPEPADTSALIHFPCIPCTIEHFILFVFINHFNVFLTFINCLTFKICQTLATTHTYYIIGSKGILY